MSEQVILQEEVDHFLANQEQLARKYAGQHIIVKGQRVIGACDTMDEAIEKGLKETTGDFLVRHVDELEDPVTFMPTRIEAPLE